MLGIWGIRKVEVGGGVGLGEVGREGGGVVEGVEGLEEVEGGCWLKWFDVNRYLVGGLGKVWVLMVV